MTSVLFNLVLALLVVTSPALALGVQYDEQAEHEEKTEKHEKLQAFATVPRAARAPARPRAPQTFQHVDGAVRFRDTASTHTVPPRQLTERRLI